MKFFTEEEFNCPCGCGLGFKDMNKKFTYSLEQAREYAALPFKLNSTIRCTKHNKAVKGSDISSHLAGRAADISCIYSVNRYKIIKSLLKAGFTRIGVAKTFIHVDNDGDKPEETLWTY